MTSVLDQMRKVLKSKNLLTLKSVFPFGKHKGELVQDVLAEDASYLIWWAENVKEWPLEKEIETCADALQDEDDDFPSDN